MNLTPAASHALLLALRDTRHRVPYLSTDDRAAVRRELSRADLVEYRPDGCYLTAAGREVARAMRASAAASEYTPEETPASVATS